MNSNNPQRTLILLTGSRVAGKDTFFKLLAKARPNKFKRFAFADALKEDLEDLSVGMFGKTVFDLNDKDKEIFRPILIAYGCAYREIDPLHWVKVVSDDILTYVRFTDFTPVITDCRFANEASYFKDSDVFGRVIVVKIERIDSEVEPTEAEKRNQPAVDKLVNYIIEWPTIILSKDLTTDQQTALLEENLMPQVEAFLQDYHL